MPAIGWLTWHIDWWWWWSTGADSLTGACRDVSDEWRQPIVEDSVVRCELRADGAGTVLTFTHRGLGVRNAGGFIGGTHAYLDRCGLPGRRPDAGVGAQAPRSQPSVFEGE